MSKIRIAFVIDQMNIGGTERQLKYLLEGLDRQTFEPFLFLLRGSADHPFMPENVPAEVLNVGSLLSYNGFGKLFFFKKALQNRGVQIVQTFFQDATSFGVLAAKLAGVPQIVVSIRDMLFWATPVSLWVHRQMVTMADSVLVNSDAVKEHVECYTKTPVQVIHNGIQINHLPINKTKAKNALCTEFGTDLDIPIVVMVANCNRKVKRVDLLVESIPLVVKEAWAFFLIVGEGHLRPALEQMAKDLKIEQYVKFPGHRNDVAGIYAGSDIAVNTSESEGFSNSLLEAMKFGLPVIASDVPGNRELVKNFDSGLLFMPNNSKDLSRKILELIKDPTLGHQLGKKARQRVDSRFSISKMLVDHAAFYQSLLMA